MNDEQEQRIERALSELDRKASDTRDQLRRLEQLDRKISDTQAHLKQLEEKISDTQKKAKRINDVTLTSTDMFFVSTWILLVLAFVVGLTSNPSKEKHIARMTDRITKSDAEIDLIRQRFPELETYVFKDLVRYDSYWCCSALVLPVNGMEIPISFGIFGNIFDTKTAEELEKRFGAHN